MSYLIVGDDCYVSRDYVRGTWEMTKKECRAHYFSTKKSAMFVLSSINAVHTQTIGSRNLKIVEK